MSDDDWVFIFIPGDTLVEAFQALGRPAASLSMPPAIPGEEWRPIPDIPGYEVSDHGRVRSKIRILKPARDSKGYWFFAPSIGGVMQSRARIHSHMMRAFVGPRPEGMVVRHLDDNKNNNTLANLAYGTRSENQFDAVRNGRNKNSQLAACYRGHEFTDENTYRNRGRRTCRACQREKYWRNKAAS